MMLEDVHLGTKKIKEMLDVICDNDELRMEFERQLQINKQLLYNPEELMKKINDIDYLEIKEKIKVLAKDRNLM